MSLRVIKWLCLAFFVLSVFLACGNACNGNVGLTLVWIVSAAAHVVMFTQTQESIARFAAWDAAFARCEAYIDCTRKDAWDQQHWDNLLAELRKYQ